MLEPIHRICLQNNDFPSLINGIASCFGMTQFSRKSLVLKRACAPSMVRAMPPSDLSVPKLKSFEPKLLILPVFFE